MPRSGIVRSNVVLACVVLVVFIFLLSSCDNSRLETGLRRSAMIFPLSVGNAWTYRESVFCISDGATWDRIQARSDRITGLSRFKGQDFYLLDRGCVGTTC